KPLLFTTVDIVADDGTSCPAYVPGEIVVTGPTIAAGYYRDPDATARTMPDGRLFTGDIGYLDDDSDLWVLSRRNDLIVSGGENVYPAEIERIIMSHPAVAAAAVVGLPHDEWGQQVAAMVVTRPHEVITSDELSTYLRERLAGYKRPRIVEFVEELPLTGSGKINRSEVVRLLSAQVETP
ncbi:MAG: AMP-binding protein, partial [Anaerolineae bacterium]|nr:AMP-binding protein [Anaerolineae bacterium]